MTKIGRYLCMMYYTGRLHPSCCYKKRSAKYFLARCVEIPLEKKDNGLSTTWTQLLSGDLAKLNSSARYRALGGRAQEEDLKDLMSIDGREDFVRENEMYLYFAVGRMFKKLVTKH